MHLIVNWMTILCFTGLLLIPQKKEFTWLAIGAAVLGFFGYMLNVNTANIALSDLKPPGRLMGIMVGFYSAIACFSNLLVPRPYWFFTC